MAKVEVHSRDSNVILCMGVSTRSLVHHRATPDKLHCLSGRTKRAEHASLRDADARLAVLLEIVTGIKAVKLLGWEAEYMRTIRAKRDARTILGLVGDLVCIFLGKA